MDKSAILLAERNSEQRRTLTSFLLHNGFEVKEEDDARGVLRALRHQHPFALLIINASLTRPGDGVQLAKQLHQWNSTIPVIVIAAPSSEDLAVAAVKAGVVDYFRPPFSLDEVLASVQRCLAQVERRSRSFEPDTTLVPMVGTSQAIQAVKTTVVRIAATDSTVLVTGETGTGKELVARAIHHASRRQQRPFIDLNCAAIPDNLLESELFGYEHGAFTGANAAYEGKLRLASSGTIFFDEIGDMSSYAQAKILRAIESRQVQSLGGRKTYPVDIRIIAATNQELDRLIAAGTFRKDLYYRLNVARIHLPPLRERQEDIPLLCAHYIDEFNRQFRHEVEGLTDETLDAFLRYDWPGNVRELKNLLEAIFVQCPDCKLSLRDLPEPLCKRLLDSCTLAQDERTQLLSSLCATNWNKSKAAQQLHWSRVTLYRKMWKYHIINKKDADRDALRS
ncbi:MAG TPA: sigma-54 dependent transcriptional regulator [Methylomirabilota bacterium]|nr:sigma-54 dependent transcriptional regulator [Methylomirabilota bacterium]